MFKNSNSNKARTLRFQFVGEGMDGLAEEAAALGLSDIVETKSPLSFADITRLQRKADAFLVLGRPSSRRGYELVAGAKLFHYLKLARPIIGVLPQDESRKILHRLGVRTVANIDSPPEIIAVLEQVLDARMNGNLSTLLPDRTACEV